MKVKILKSVNGKVNGVQMGPYYLDHEYDLDQERAELFIGSAMAEEVLPLVKAKEEGEPLLVMSYSRANIQ